MLVAREVLVLLVILSLGGTITFLLYEEVVSSECSLSRESFKGAFSALLANFATFLSDNLRSVRAIADAMSSLGPELPDPVEIDKICREYSSQSRAELRVSGILARVPNDVPALLAWESSASARHGRNVTITPFDSDHSDVHDAFVYVLQDTIPLSPLTAAWQGYRLTSLPPLRQAVAESVRPVIPGANTKTLIPFFDHQVAVTGLYTFDGVFGESGSRTSAGMMFFTTVFDSDPSKYLVVTSTTFSDYVESVAAVSPEYALEIEDHRGQTFSTGDCPVGSVDQLLTKSVELMNATKWTVKIGQCPRYKDSFVTWRRYVIVAICLTTTAMAIIVSVLAMMYQRKTVQQVVEIVRNEEKTAALQLVVGYICHELRNPLHVIKTSFRSVVAINRIANRLVSQKDSACSSKEGAVSDALSALLLEEEDVPDDDEIDTILLDAVVALQQMQTTVNEVLDYRAINAGLSSLKLDRATCSLETVVLPVLLRGRSHLPCGVTVNYLNCDETGIAFVDKARLSQIITNGLIYAGKLVLPGDEVTVTVALMKVIRATTGNQGPSAPTSSRPAKSVPSFRSVLSSKSVKSVKTVKVAPYHRRFSKLYRDTVASSGSESRYGFEEDKWDQYLCVTVSFPRRTCIAKPEDCFVPFQQKKAAGSWQPVQSSPEHVSKMKAIWLASMDRGKSHEGKSLPVKTHSKLDGVGQGTTGLGLPLCRGFAHASGGWLALEQSQGDGKTHYWCVLESPYFAPVVSTSNITTRFTTTSLSRSRSRSPVARRPSRVSSRRLIGDSKSVRALILGTASDAPQLQQEAVPALPPFLPAATIHGSHSTASGDDQQTHRSVAPGIAPSSGHSPVQTEVIEITDCEAETAAFHESERAKASIRESAPQLGTGNVQAPRRPSETASTARRNVETEKFQSLRVAVVDDEPANQRIACRFLKALGVPPANITVMRDGDDALTLIQSVHESFSVSSEVKEQKPGGSADGLKSHVDIMLLDIRMPGKSGLDVMQEAPRPLPFPVVAMTGNVDKESLEEYKRTGFTGCIGKPFEKKMMKEAVETALEGRWFCLQ